MRVRWPFSWYTIRAGSSVHNSGGQVIGIDSVVNHPDYEGTTLDNDICIIILSSPLVFGDSVATIALPSADLVLADGVATTVTGWGALIENGTSPLQLQAVTVPIVNRETCNELYSVANYTVFDSMICAGFVGEGGRDACQVIMGKYLLKILLNLLLMF